MSRPANDHAPPPDVTAVVARSPSKLEFTVIVEPASAVPASDGVSSAVVELAVVMTGCGGAVVSRPFVTRVAVKSAISFPRESVMELVVLV